MPQHFPIVNGYAASWVELTISIFGEATNLVQSIEYSNEFARGMGRGRSGKKKLRTRGTEEPAAKIAFYSRGFRDFRRTLAAAGTALSRPLPWKDVPFDITCSWENDDGDIETDQIVSCVMGNFSKTSSDDSEDAAVVECDLDIMDINLDGDETE